MSIDDFENKLNRLEKKETKSHIGSIVTIVVISAAVWYGIKSYYNPKIKNDKEIEDKIKEDKKRPNNLQILSIQDNKILVYKTDQINKKIKLINIETNKIIDITQSDMEASTTILSNNGKNIVYLSNSANHTNLYMIMLDNNSIIKIFDSKNITYNFNMPCNKIENDYLKICKWTRIEWSPNSDKISFFTCSKDMSFLTIVDTTKNSKPKIIRDSIVCNNFEREHRWLKNEKIIFSSADCLYSIYPLNNKPSKMIYGNISN